MKILNKLILDERKMPKEEEKVPVKEEEEKFQSRKTISKLVMFS